MIQTVSGNHQSTAHKRDRDFIGVRWQFVSEPRCSSNTAKTTEHQEKDLRAAMLSETIDQSYSAEQRNQQREAAMHFFFCGQKVGKDS